MGPQLAQRPGRLVGECSRPDTLITTWTEAKICDGSPEFRDSALEMEPVHENRSSMFRSKLIQLLTCYIGTGGCFTMFIYIYIYIMSISISISIYIYICIYMWIRGYQLGMVLDVLRLCACCYDPFQRFKGSWLTSLYFSRLLQYGGLEPKWSLVLGPFGWSMYMLLLLHTHSHPPRPISFAVWAPGMGPYISQEFSFWIIRLCRVIIQCRRLAKSTHAHAIETNRCLYMIQTLSVVAKPAKTCIFTCNGLPTKKIVDGWRLPSRSSEQPLKLRPRLEINSTCKSKCQTSSCLSCKS